MDSLMDLLFDDEEHYAANVRRRRRRAFFVAFVLYARSFKDSLDAEGRRRRDRRLPLDSLPSPSTAAWQTLYDSRNDQGMITVTGLDYNTFSDLLAQFSHFFYMYTPWTGDCDGRTMDLLKNSSTGHKRKVKAHACLALALTYYRFRGPFYILQGWFGFTGTHLSVWLRFARRILLFVLRKSRDTCIRIPTDDNIQELKDSIAARHPQLTDVYCVCDGLKLHFQSCEGLSKQSVFYNGWTHGHYVSNLFVFSADGRIIMCIINAPGSVHDSQLADWGDVYTQLETIFLRTGGICCVDSAFASNEADYLIRSSSDLTKATDALDHMRLVQATSLRQAAEWGMNGLERAFPRLLDTIRYEEDGKRSFILQLVPYIYNYRLERVGLNQIRNVYNPCLSVDSRYLMGFH